MTPRSSAVPGQNVVVGRPDVLESFAVHVYGRTPVIAVQSEVTVAELATGPGESRREVLRVDLSNERGRVSIDVLLVLPPSTDAPVVVVPNFTGIHAVDPDPQIPLPKGWVPARAGVTDGATAAHVAHSADRGCERTAWPLELITAAGFGLATFYAGDAEPDRPGAEAVGVRDLVDPHPDAPWGALGAWAWAASRVREAVATRPGTRADAMVAMGHSRMGKASLWAAAQDEGFAAAVSNQSGCAGASLARHVAGEDIRAITTRFPHWFTPRYASYAGRDADLPVDQDLLLASIAPRPLYVGSAIDDVWADPLGEYLAVCGAATAYSAAGGRIGYHMRPGGHGISAEDWSHYLTFLAHHLPGRA